MLIVMIIGLTLNIDVFLKAVLDCLHENNITVPGLNSVEELRDYLGLSAEEFATLVANGSIGNQQDVKNFSTMWYASAIILPFDTDMDLDYKLESHQKKKVSAADVHPVIINYLVSLISVFGENGIYLDNYTGWRSLISDDENNIEEIIETVEKVVLGNFDEYLNLLGIVPQKLMTDMGYADETVQAWVKGEKEFERSDRIAIAEKYGIIKTGVKSKK